MKQPSASYLSPLCQHGCIAGIADQWREQIEREVDVLTREPYFVKPSAMELIFGAGRINRRVENVEGLLRTGAFGESDPDEEATQ